jgi:hypothetical protein
MTVKLTGCMNLVTKMPEEDQERLLKRLDDYEAKGVPREKAQVMATKDTLAEVRAEREELHGHVREQHPDLFKGLPPLRVYHGSRHGPVEGAARMEPHDETGHPGFSVSLGEKTARRYAHDVDERHDDPPTNPTVNAFDLHGKLMGWQELLQATRERLKLGDTALPTREQVNETARSMGVTAVDHRQNLGIDELSVIHPDALRPVSQENAQVAKDQTETPAFKAWFGDSKVVDAEGKPLVVYHGTSRDFSTFDDSKMSPTRVKFGDAKGYYFSADKGYSEAYGSGQGHNVMPVFLSMKNPKYVQSTVGTAYFNPRMIEKLRGEGHDGVVYRGDDAHGGGSEYVVFEPTQIKSAIGNNGDFDPTKGDISKHFDLTRENSNFFGDPHDETALALQSAIEGKTLRQAVEHVVSNSTDASYREIGQRVLDRMAELENHGVQFDLKIAHVGDSVPRSLLGARGLAHYVYGKEGETPASHTVWINGHDVTGKSGMSEETLMHEAIHTVTQSALRLGNYSKAAGTDAATLSHEMFALSNALVKHFNKRAAEAKAGGTPLTEFEQAIFERRSNSLQSPDEVLSWGLTNKPMQEWMETVPFDSKQSLWGKFVDSIRGFLGLEPKANTALSELLRLADRAFDSPVHELKKLASERGESLQVQTPAGEQNNTQQRPREDREARTTPPVVHADRAVTLTQRAGDTLSRAWHDLTDGILPMSSGSEIAQATLKDYANEERAARDQWLRFDQILIKHFKEDELVRMSDAAEEENLIRGGDIPASPDMGLASLTPVQRATVETLHAYADERFEAAKAAGMYEGPGVPYWMPRISVVMDEEGRAMRPRDSTTVGRNIVTTAPSLKGRKYKTIDETERAMKQLFGDGAEVVRNIRAMPLAMARLDRAIAGKNLVDKIRTMGMTVGQEFVRDGEAPGYEKIDLPGVRGANLYVAQEWAGPVRSVMYDPPGKWEGRFMDAKAESTSLIMYTPFMHGTTVFGKAFPASWSLSKPGEKAAFLATGGLSGVVRMVALATRGYQLRKIDGLSAAEQKARYGEIKELIRAGLVPFSGRGARQDITGIVNDPRLTPGHGLKSRAIGGAVGLLNKRAGEATKRGLDKFGDVWHGTLLWNRIADFQVGLAAHARDYYEELHLKQGMTAEQARYAALRQAAHTANRYTGAISSEAMSQGTRKLLGWTLFSRSYNVTNIGAFKDAGMGLPSEIQAQLKINQGPDVADKANVAYRKKARSALMMDIGVTYIANSIFQDLLDHFKRDKSWSDIEQGYVDRFHEAMTKAYKDPMAIMPFVGHPFEWTHSFFSNSENEPGKQNRIKIDKMSDGTWVYARSALGKMGEDLEGWSGDFFNTLWKKTGSLIRPAIEVAMEARDPDKPIAARIWTPDDNALQAIGKAVVHILGGAVPVNDAMTLGDLLSGTSASAGMSQQGKDLAAQEKAKLLVPIVSGVTLSRGYPGGAVAGELAHNETMQRQRKEALLPEANKLLKTGIEADRDKAIGIMLDLKMAPPEIISHIKGQIAPESRVTAKREIKDARFMSEDEMAKLKRAGAQ